MLTKRRKISNWILVVFLIVLSLFFLFPVIWMLANSFKGDAQITADMNTAAALYNGPVISDHRSKKYREHGKIQ